MYLQWQYSSPSVKHGETARVRSSPGPFWDHTLCAVVNDLCVRNAMHRASVVRTIPDLGKRATATSWGSSGSNPTWSLAQCGLAGRRRSCQMTTVLTTTVTKVGPSTTSASAPKCRHRAWSPRLPAPGSVGSLSGTRTGRDRVQRSHCVEEQLAVVERRQSAGRWCTDTGKSTFVADDRRTGVVDLSHGQLVVGRSTLGVLGCV
jgi:hypothetical protein